MKLRRPQILVLVLLLALSVWLALTWRTQTMSKRYHQIEDGLYLGEAVNEPPIGTQAVVNLCGRKDMYDVEHELHRPVYDQGNVQPTLDWLKEIVAFIDTQREAERVVYVHCLSGMNRSPAAVMAYLMFKHGWTREQAFQYVQQRRPEVAPNPQLMRLLKDWEGYLDEERKRLEE